MDNKTAQKGTIKMKEKVVDYLKLTRISNSPSVASNVLAGVALAGVLIPSKEVILLILAMVAMYVAGMILNDICDIRFDAKTRPDRPLVTGRVSRNEAILLTAVIFAFGSGILWVESLRAFLSGLVLIALIITYNLWHKNNPFGPGLMALCRVFVYISVFLAFRNYISGALLIAGVLLGLYIIGVTYLSKIGVRSEYIGGLIAGVSLYDAFVIALAGGTITVLGAVAAFGLTLYLQKFIKGT